MINLQDEDVVVYETADVECEPDALDAVQCESTEFIECGQVSRGEAVEAFVTVRDFASGDGLDAKIADIRSQIELLRLDHSDKRIDSLSSDLRALADGSAARAAELARVDAVATQVPEEPPHSSYFSGRIPAETHDRIALLESRLAGIESRVGFSALPMPLTAAVQGAQEKLDILTSSKSQVDTAVHNLQELGAFLRRTPVSDTVGRVHDSLVTLDPVIEALPMVVSRLKSLQALHADTSACQSILRDMDATLRTMKSDIDRWVKTLDDLEPKLGAAVNTTRRNVETVESYLS